MSRCADICRRLIKEEILISCDRDWPAIKNNLVGIGEFEVGVND